MTKFEKLEHFPYLLKGRMNSFITTSFDDSMTVEMQIRVLIEWIKKNIELTNDQTDYLNQFIEQFDSKLYKTVEEVLTKWLEDGTIKDIVDELVSKSKVSIHGSRILSLAEYPRLATEISDEFRIQRMIDDANDYDILEFSDAKKLYLTTKTTPLVITKPLSLLGFGVEFVLECECSPYTLKVLGTHNVLIKDIHFNQNLKGRNSLWFEDCQDVMVSGCSFTGYTAEFGYYKTDSGIMLYNVTGSKIYDCSFFDHGNQYDETTETLNRCITHQGTSTECDIRGCSFKRVNQAIVSDTGSIFVSYCSFEEVHDNDFYLLGGRAIVSHCDMNDRYDECIVAGHMEYLAISNLSVKNVPNKFLAITADNDEIVLENCTIYNEIDEGQFIVWRESNYKVNKLTINNVTFKNDRYKFFYPFLEVFNIHDFTCNNLTMNVAIAKDQNVLKFTNVNGLIANLDLKKVSGEGSGRVSIDLTSNISIKDVTLDGMRIQKSTSINTIGSRIQTNISVPYIIEESGRSIFYVDSKPQPQNDEKNLWKQGDIAYNILLNPNEGHNTNVFMWVFNGVEWIEMLFIDKGQFGTFNPNNNRTPRFLGEIFTRTDLKESYIAVGLTNSDWKKITTT